VIVGLTPESQRLMLERQNQGCLLAPKRPLEHQIEGGNSRQSTWRNVTGRMARRRRRINTHGSRESRSPASWMSHIGSGTVWDLWMLKAVLDEDRPLSEELAAAVDNGRPVA